MATVPIKSAWGADDPTRASFPFLHVKAFAEEGFAIPKTLVDVVLCADTVLAE